MAETFKLGNTKWGVKEGSLLAYNDENENFKPLPFTFTRASTATRVNENGLIEVVKSGIPRIDYTDNPDGHLLLEPARTNYFLKSNEFNISPWNIPNSSALLAPNQSGVFNSNTAWKLTQNTNTGYHYITQGVNLTGNHVFSIYAKAGECKGISFYIPKNTSGSGYGVTAFDLESGTYLLNENNAISESLGDGWYRLSLQTYLAGATNMSIYVIQSIQQAETGDGISGIYIQNAQLEAGSYATSYIPTDGTTVTRAAETCTGAGNAQVFNDTEGVLFANVAALANGGSVRVIRLRGSSNANVIYIAFQSTANSITSELIVGSVSQASINSTAISQINFNKIGCKYKANDFALWINGSEIGVDPLGSTFLSDTLTTIDFNFGTIFPFYGKVKQIGVYDTALTDEELETLTT